MPSNNYAHENFDGIPLVCIMISISCFSKHIRKHSSSKTISKFPLSKQNRFQHVQSIEKKVRKSSGNLCSQNQTDLHLQVEGRLQKGFQNNARALLKAKTKGQYYTFTDDTCSNTCS